MCTAMILTEVLHCFFPSKPGRISPMLFLVCTQPWFKMSLPGLTTSILPNNRFLSHFATPTPSLSRSCCDAVETNTHQRLAAKAALPPAARKPSNPPCCPHYDTDTKQNDRRSLPAATSPKNRALSSIGAPRPAWDCSGKLPRDIKGAHTELCDSPSFLQLCP